MISPKSPKKIADNLSPWYRSLFTVTVNEQVYAGEDVVFTCDYSGVGMFPYNEYGFLIFTTRRYLKVFATDEFLGETYFKSGTLFDRLNGREVENRKWIDPSEHYKEKYLNSLELPRFADFEYSSIKGIIKTNYEIEVNEEVLKLTEIRWDFNDEVSSTEARWNKYYVFKKIDGEQVYKLVNVALQNDGKVIPATKEKATDSKTILLLNQLADLHKAGVLTDEEFERKKKDILKRL